MKRLPAVLLATSLVFGCAALAQTAPPTTVAASFDKALTAAEKSVTGVAEAMPEDKYTYAPTQGKFDGVRNFGTQLKHVAVANYALGAALLGEKPPVELGGADGPANIKTKAETLKFLADSFAYAHKALQSMDEKNMLTPIPSPFGKNQTTRLMLAISVTAHPYDHFGQMVEYLRSNGIAPPSSM